MKRRESIRFRITFGLAIILILSVSISIVLTTTNQRRNLLDASQQTLAINNEMLNATIRNIMLSGEAPIANRTIEDFRNITGFLEFEVYRTDGSTAFNDYETLEFVNDFQDRIMFDQTPRTETRSITGDGFNRTLKFKTPVVIRNDEAMEMEYFFPILNYADCRVCHGTDQFVRGVSHFRISLAGVFGQVNRAAVMLTGYFITVGIILFAWIFVLVRRTIVTPVLRIGEVVNVAATGKLDVQVDLDRRGEVGDLAGKVNGMIVGLRERQELEIQNRMNETRLEENRKYLDNIKEGLLLLNHERRITGQYSVFLSRLFRRKEIAGLTMEDFIYPDAERHTQERRELQAFLEMLFTNTTADMEMIMSINPLAEATLPIGEGDSINVRADFLRIHENGELANVMAIFEDRTDIVETRNQLEEQRLRRESELEQIAMVLKAGPEVFEGFIDEAAAAFGNLEKGIDRLDDAGFTAGLFRDIHSVKGTARYLDFPKVEELSHLVEGLLAEVRDGKRQPDVSLRQTLERVLGQLNDELASVRGLIDRFRDFVVDRPAGALSPMAVFTERLTGMVGDIAADLEKEVEFSVETQLSDIPRLGDIQSSIFHLIRNALDHGIEDSYERMGQGKPGTARLILRLSLQEDMLRVEVEDDGRGLDLEDIERRGVESGLLKPGTHLPSQIVNVLFRPGFSSRDDATELSGRGVGLDAVKDDVRKWGGRINVRTATNRGTAFILMVPVETDGEAATR